MKYLESLNEQQTEAVTTTEGPVRVIAGAGTGKTRALTARFCFLTDMLGIDPAAILCVTFTNKAAAEMKQRSSATSISALSVHFILSACACSKRIFMC